MQTSYKALIPAAGYGTRMNLLPTQAKEMLLDPNTGVPLIQYHLDVCKEHNIIPHVITRKDKHDLISYLTEHNIEYSLNAPEGEWPHAILSSYEFWGDKNFLFLPDTRFEGKNVINDMKNSIDLGANSCFAIHQVDDVSKWGQVVDYSVIEKPKNNTSGWAWGIAAFNKQSGKAWLETMNTRNKPYYLLNSSFVYMDKFVDITRAGVLERY